MIKAELESKHIAELHALAAEAGVANYRMLRREDLVEQLLSGGSVVEEKPAGEKRERPPRRRRERAAGEKPAERSGRERERAPRREREPRKEREPRQPETSAAEPEPVPAAAPSATASSDEPPRPRRRRRRRRFGRKKGLRVQDLLTSPPGRQALVYGESRAACTALLREVAGELAGASEGPDPIALLVDPSPEELADWKREAPQAEIVSAGQARHASDALAQAARRAEGGEDVILLVDSLTKLAESFDDADAAKAIFDGAIASAKGSLTVVAALERPA